SRRDTDVTAAPAEHGSWRLEWHIGRHCRTCKQCCQRDAAKKMLFHDSPSRLRLPKRTNPTGGEKGSIPCRGKDVAAGPQLGWKYLDRKQKTPALGAGVPVVLRLEHRGQDPRPTRHSLAPVMSVSVTAPSSARVHHTLRIQMSPRIGEGSP